MPRPSAQKESVPTQVLDEAILSILRCPVTGSRLSLRDNWLISEVGGLGYPIRDGIPVLLSEAAKLPEGFASLEAFRAHFQSQINRP
jgi:uncharacterized protein YbaR (Trm112 family)